MGAAEHWAGGAVIDKTAEDAAVMGIELPDDLVSEGQDDYEVTPEAWPAVSMFLKVQTQWRVGMGGVIGLDYGAVRWCFELEQVSDQRQLLEDLQVIEGRVVEILSQRDG